MARKQQRYFSYLLRLWRVRSNDKPKWRASLECPRTGKRQGFARLADLVTFLEAKVEDNCSDLSSES